MAYAGQPQETQEPEPLPLASTVTAIGGGQTKTFTDATLIGKDESELVGKWIRVFTADQPAGLIVQITAFDSDTGAITLKDPLPAGAVEENDVYHLADSRDVLLPTNIDPASIGLGSIGCSPSGTNQADAITCFAIDATGVDAQKGDDTVSVTSPTIVLVTKFGSDKKEDESEKKESESESEAKAFDLGDGSDRLVNDGTVVSAAIAVVSETPKDPTDDKKNADKKNANAQKEEDSDDEKKVAATAGPTAIGIDAGAGQNVITNNGTISTSATAIILAREIPGDAKEQKNADVSSTATSTSTAIKTGDDGSFITNTGRLASRAIAIAAGLGISTSPGEGEGNPPQSTAAPAQEKKEGEDSNNFTAKGDVTATATATGITAGSGNDTVTSTGEIVVTGSAVTVDAGAAQIEAKGKATASATATSTATAQGMALGDGNDVVINAGTLTVGATARAVSLEIAIADKNNESKPGSGSENPSGKPADQANEAANSKELSSTVDGSAKATATATGISTDGTEAGPTSEPIFKLGSGNLTVGRETTETRPGGNDSVTNSGTIDVSATARSVAGAGGITVDGNASVKITSRAEATSVAADLGAGNDSLNNTGTITSTADAAATAIGIVVAQKAEPSGSTPPDGGGGTEAAAKPAKDEENTIVIKTTIEGSAVATSTAIGITADGALSTTDDKWTATANLNREVEFNRETRTTQAAGTDTITNSGVISALATSTTRAVTAGISADGAATVKATSTADASARGIDLGGGSDTLTNTADGQLTTNANATADALSLAIGFKTDQTAKEEVKSAATVETNATARAIGVSADGIEADSSQTIKLGVSTSHLTLDIEKTTTLARGNDIVTNNGAIATTATATTNAVGIAFSADGKATVDATSTAQAESSAIDAGAGNDTVTNTGAINVVANSTANALGVSVGVTSGTDPPSTPPSGTTPEAAQKPPTTPPAPTPASLGSTAEASAQSTATAIGISADSLSAEIERRLQLQIGGGPSFIMLADASTRPGGNDTVTNSGTVDVSASATSGALAVSVTTDGKAAAKVTSEAEASAAGIDLGGANDTLNNTGGTINATADAIARALSASVGIKSGQNAKSTAESAADASVSAEARAVGIAADALQTDSTVGLTIQHLEGVLSMNAQGSLTRPVGDDTVSNAADVTSRATAFSREVSGGVAIDGKAAVKSSSTATAEAAGIDLGGGNDALTANTGDVTVSADATARSLAVAVGVQSSSGGSSTPSSGATGDVTAEATPEKPKATAAASEATVEASVTSAATAIGLAADSLRADQTAAVSVSLEGLRPQVHVEIAQTRAGGDDSVRNDGAITTTATSASRAIGAGISVGGDVTVKTTSEANATAAGVDLGGGNDTLTNNGAVLASATSLAEAVSLSLVGKAESSSSEPQKAKSTVDAGATAEARATGLAADSTVGDTLLTVDLAVADSLSAGATFGFLNSEARASGDDRVTNTANVTANANASTLAVGVSLVAEGAASAGTSSTAEAAATAIDLGAGADSLTNSGNLEAISTATAGAIGLSLNNKGRAGSFEGFFAASEGLWKGGIEANATALGIDGAGAAAKSTSLNVTLTGTSVDVRFQKLEDSITADKADTITNTGNIGATANAFAGSINIAASAEGSAGAVSDLESKALAVGIQGGQGDDTIDNLGFNRVTFATATALTGGLAVAVSGKGIAVAGDTLWSTGTQANATAIGIDGDGGLFKSKSIVFLGTELTIEKKEAGGTGNDAITNEQFIFSVASATAPSLGVAIEAKKGVAATLSGVETTAAATGIRGGGGNDFVLNLGQLFTGASALSVAANIAIAKEGVAAAGGAVWDGGTKAEAAAVGIDGDGVSTSTKTTTMTVSTDGVSIVHEKKEDTVAGAGDDTIRNFAGITVAASAESDTLAVAGTTKGVSAAFGQSTTEATAAAIRGGAGDDSITNEGELNATATSIARALNVSVETTGGVAIAGNNVFKGGTTAEARATGIAGDGGSTKTTTTTISIGGGDLIDIVKTDVAATGDDTITNTAKIEVLADARAPSASAAVPIKGMGLAVSTSTAEAIAAAIDAGGGHNVVTNTGELKSTANATAATANVAVTKAGVALAADAVWDGGTRAGATANGIVAGAGQTTVTNSGAIEANSGAITLSGSVAVAISGVAGATATSTAESRAAGIDLGQTEVVELLVNTGAINVNALALAATAAVSVTNAGLAVSADSVWDGGTKANAVARGIGGSEGSDTVLNGGRIEVGANAATGSATVAVAVSGVAAALGTATGDASASAIDLGGGADLLINRGQLISEAFALAGTVNVGFTSAGVSVAGNDVWDGGTKAQAVVKTIGTGDGNDVVMNAGDVSANADAVTVAVPVSIALSGVGIAIGTSTATSVATAIDGGDGDNTITNRNAGLPDRTGKLVADATAHAVTATVAVTTAGVAGASDAVWDGGTTAEATARGIKTSLGGNDTIDNDGAIEATSTARSGSASVAVAVAGVAVALANSTALSNAAAIDTGAKPDDLLFGGADKDTVTNRGDLTVNANAFAISVPVSVSGAGPAIAGNSVWDGGTTADAKAAGIATRAGDDVIANSGAIRADADATSGSVGVSVAVAGFAASVATSTAKAEASAIDAGTGDDRVTNTGKLTADTTALAGTVTVAVTPAGVAVAGDAVWDGGTKAEAASRTIAAGDGADRVRNVGDVTATSVADTASVAVSVAVAGVGVTSATSTATSNATAIDLGAGDDTVVNMNGGQADRAGKLTADATANAVAASVTVTPGGVAIASDAVWRGGTTANAGAAAIDGGLGADTVVNTSEVDVDSTARTGSVSAAITVFGVSAALVDSTANASGAGITTGVNVRDDAGLPVDADLAAENDSVFNSGRLVVDVDALATSLGIGFSFGGVSAAASNLWDGGTTATAAAWGIGLGNGADIVANAGEVDIASIANAVSATFGITVFGVSAAASTATANAQSTGLDGGDGNDIITNLLTGTLTSDATATGVGANVGFVAIGATAAGDTVWNGGTKANTIARGADGGLGNDEIANDGTIAAKADSTTASVSVSITGIGVGGATATSTATATAMGVDGGDGNDTITSRGDTTATALSTATGVAVSATGVGVGAAFDSFFNGGTQGNAIATGLAGGDGNDAITLAQKTVTADAASDTHSTSVSVTLVGLAAGTAASTSAGTATGIDGGAGVDTILVDSALVSKATATADGNTVAVSSLGAIAGAFDSATRAESVAVGVAGGDDADTIVLTEKAVTTLTSDASTKDTKVSVTTALVALSDSQAVSTARATGVAGGAGNDTVSQDGVLTATLTAESKSRTVSVNIAGGLSAGDASGRSVIAATGIDGGQGDDRIVNTGDISLVGTATARGNAVSVIGSGFSDAAAVATSDASVTGLQGGDGTDEVINGVGAEATADATAQAFANGLAFSLTVAGHSDTRAAPTATATGLDGGAGDDKVANDGTVMARANATSSATGSSITILGGAAKTAGSDAIANVTGLFGGIGNDRVFNRSLVNATGTASATVNDSSWTLAGTAGNSSMFNAGGLATGLGGGAGLDHLVNSGSLNVSFASTLSATGGSKAIFGGANANTQLTAAGGAIGIAGDADDDLIENDGAVDVNASASATATKASVSFAGAPTNEALLSAHATATGLGGGSGNDGIWNRDQLTVRATGNSDVIGGAEATVIGGTTSNGVGTANATATGIHGDDGSNSITNTGLIFLEARGDAATTNSSASGLFFSEADARSDARSTVTGIGIAVNGGNNRIANQGNLIISVDASAYANAYASGAHVSIAGDATTRADARSRGTAAGIRALDGANEIFNSGLMSVLATAGTNRTVTRQDDFCSTSLQDDPDAPILNEDGTQAVDEDGNPLFEQKEATACVPRTITVQGSATYAAANGNGANGVGRATSFADARARAFGIHAGDGSNLIVNLADGRIDVTARPTARAVAFADGDLLAEAFGTATATATASAIGLRAGHGDNRIFNFGTINVLAEPAVRVSIDVTTSEPVCVDFFFGTWCTKDGGKGTARANATFNATAVGIEVGDGANLIVNDGLLSVTAAPVTGDPITITHANDSPESTSIVANAIGIRTGDGDNSIVNKTDGVIDVEAKFPQTCSGSCSDSLTAVGIQTGGGDDTIVNDGTITVSATGHTLSTAINAGAGNDRVVLGSDSHTGGNVLLGTGNDELVWGDGATLAGNLTLGGGFNTFALGGSRDAALNLSGAFTIGGINVFNGFNAFRKEGSATWTLTGARAMNWGVGEGTLAIAGALTGTVATEASASTNPTVAVNATGVLASLGAAPAVRLQTNGVLINEGLIQAHGLAVDATAGSGSVVFNEGTIASATGLAIQGGSGSEHVANAGTITGGAGMALDLGAGDDTLTLFDSSIINGVSHGGFGSDTLVLGGPTGVLDLTNFAENYTSFEATVQQAGLWTLVGDGAIDLTVNQGLVNVVSDLTGTLGTSNKGNALIFVDSFGSVTSDEQKPAVALEGPHALINAGEIDGPVAALGGGSSVLNYGVIENTGGVAVVGGDGAQHVENHGFIGGGTGTAIDLGGGDDLLQLSTSARVGGVVLGGTGFDTLNLTGGGSVRLDLNTFDAFEKLQKEGGGLWMVTGSNTMAWDVRTGTLVLNGNLTGAGSVQPGSLLAGNGFVGSLHNAGIVSPGLSIGSIGVLGDYVQADTGVLQVEGSVLTEFSDRLKVIGAASLAGTLEVLPESRPFGIATEYTILEAQGGVTGTFAAATSSAPYLDAYVDYLPRSVTLALVRNDISFEGMSGTANLQALGRSLDGSKRSMARGDFKGVMDQFLTLEAAQQGAALKTLGGELHASLPSTLLRTGERFFAAAATRRVNADEQGGDRMTVWTDYLRFTGDVRGNTEFSGSTYGATGLVAGADFAIGRTARLGGSFGWARGSSELDVFVSDGARVRSRMPSLYGEYSAGPVLVEGAFGYAEHSVRTARLIDVGSVRRQALADYTADQYSGLVRVSVAMPMGRAFAVAPFFETRHSQVRRRAFDETGAESVNLSGISAFTTNSLRTLVGMRATSSPRLFGTRVEPALSLAWTREGQDLRSGFQAVLSGMTSRPGFSPFTLNGVSDSRHGALIDGGASVVVGNHGRAFVAYDGLLTGARTEHSFGAGLRIVW